MGVLVDLVKKTNVATDNKAAKKQFQERFSSFELEVNLKHRLLKYASNAEFLISDYLKKKAQFLLMEEDEAAGGSGRGRSRRQRVSRSAGGDADGEPRKPKVPTREISYALFCQGMNLDQIAAERNLTKGTIIGHLTPYVMEGKIGLRTFISSAHEKKLREFMQAHPEIEHFSEIREAVGCTFEYYEIKLIHDLMVMEKGK